MKPKKVTKPTARRGPPCGILGLTRGEAIALVNTCTIAVKNVPMDMPKDFQKSLQAAVNKVMRSWGLKICTCCDLVKEVE